MQKNYFSIQSKIFADLLLLALINIIVQGDFITFFSTSNLIVLLISLPCWLFSGRTLGLYDDFRDKPFSTESVVFLKTLTLYTLLFSFTLLELLRGTPLSRMQLFMHCALILTLLPVQKLMIRIILKRIRNSDNMARKVLIVGAGETGMNFYKQYVKNSNYGYKLAGFVDDTKNASLNGQYLGKTSEIEDIIANYDLDDIVVAMPITNETPLEKIVSIGEKEGKRIRVIPDFYRFGDGKIHVGRLGALPIITIRSSPLDIVDNRFYKRLFDIAFSLLVIVFVFSWLFPIISLLIKLSSKGPVFYKQERWGLNNKPIICYKFRSMVADSSNVDEQGKYLQACKDDPRITKIGKFLRKTNIDEFPQFFNVLFGSMSIVGPRPHPVVLNMMSKETVENYMMRHWVKPGITGWAQVHGYRGETRAPYLMEKRVEFDLWYIGNWTFWLDLQIIVQTLVNMVKGEKNAY